MNTETKSVDEIVAAVDGGVNTPPPRLLREKTQNHAL